jgi:hypothetical protein
MITLHPSDRTEKVSLGLVCKTKLDRRHGLPDNDMERYVLVSSILDLHKLMHRTVNGIRQVDTYTITSHRLMLMSYSLQKPFRVPAMERQSIIQCEHSTSLFKR